MAYNPPDFYGSLRVQPDSRIIYEGLANMGQGLAAGINSATNYAGDMKKMDKQQEFAMAMQDDSQANAQQMMQAGFDQQFRMFGAQNDAHKQAKQEAKDLETQELMNYGKGRAASVIALAEVAGSPMAKTMAATLGKITDGKALADTSDAFLKAIMTETENNKPDNITEKPINGGRNTAILRNGQLFNILGGASDSQAVLTPEQLQAYGAMFPNAAVTAKLPGGVTINQKPPQEQSSTRIQTMTIPGPQVPHPTLPGQMIDGPGIPVKINSDGSYEPLTPKAGKQAGKSYGDSLFKK